MNDQETSGIDNEIYDTHVTDSILGSEQNGNQMPFGEGMIAIARMGQIGRAKDKFIAGMNRIFGEGNWTIGYSYGSSMISRDSALQLYEDSYVKFFQENRDVLNKLVKEASDVYDTYKTEVSSGTDWYNQTERSTHLQDIAIRRALIRLSERFQGKRLRKVKSDGHLPELSPGNIPFIQPELVNRFKKVEKKWIKPNTIEDFWQNNKIFMVRSNVEVTRNVTSRLQEIISQEPADDLDRFEARRGTEFLAMMGMLDKRIYLDFIRYTLRVDRLDTLRDWIFNVLEMIYHGGFVPAKGHLTERIVHSVGTLGLYVASITEHFIQDVFESRLSELSPIMKASFGLAMLEGRDTGGLKELCDRNAVASVLRSLVKDQHIVNLIRGNDYYQGRIDRLLALGRPNSEYYHECLASGTEDISASQSRRDVRNGH